MTRGGGRASGGRTVRRATAGEEGVGLWPGLPRRADRWPDRGPGSGPVPRRLVPRWSTNAFHPDARPLLRATRSRMSARPLGGCRTLSRSPAASGPLAGLGGQDSCHVLRRTRTAVRYERLPIRARARLFSVHDRQSPRDASTGEEGARFGPTIRPRSRPAPSIDPLRPMPRPLTPRRRCGRTAARVRRRSRRG